jgi:hypothetical protein
MTKYWLHFLWAKPISKNKEWKQEEDQKESK